MATKLYFMTTTGVRQNGLILPPFPDDPLALGGSIASNGANRHLDTVVDTFAGAGGGGGSIAGPATVPQGVWNYVTMPLTAAVTISGTITFNIWGYENSMNANMGFLVKVYRLAKDGTLTLLTSSAKGTELALTTAAVNNWTATPTSTAFAIGDCILVQTFFVDAGGTMGAGFQGVLWAGAATAGVAGDSYISFTETISIVATLPTTVTTLYPTPTLSSVTVSGETCRTLATSEYVGTSAATATSVTGPAEVYPVSGSANRDTWYSDVLASSVTLTLPVKIAINAYGSVGATHNAQAVGKLYYCDADGSNPVLIATTVQICNGSGEPLMGVGTTGGNAITRLMLMAGGVATVPSGKRLRLVVFFTDATTVDTPRTMISGATLNFVYGTTSTSSGLHSRIEFSDTITFGAAPTTGTGDIQFGGSGTATVTVTGTGSGAITFGGSGLAKITMNGTGTGAIAFAGSGVATVIYVGTGTGAITFGGSGTATAAFMPVGTGAIAFAGSGVPKVTLTGTGTGAITFGGSGTAVVTVSSTGSGAIAFGGSGTAIVTVNGVGTGAIAFGGSGTATFASGSTATGTGAITFGGSGVAVVTVPTSGSGAIAFGGSGAATLTLTTTGAGAIAFAGSGTQTFFMVGTGTGAILFSASGAPTVTVPGSGSGAITFGGSGTASVGNNYPASGSGAITFGASGAATVTVTGTGTAVITFGGSGVPTITVAPTGTGAIAFAGSGTQTFFMVGTGSGAITFGGSGTATVTVKPTGTGGITFAGSGTATYGSFVPASGSGAITFGGSGTATVVFIGTGTGGISFAGTGIPRVTVITAGSGAIAFSGAGIAKVTSIGVGSGSITFAGTGTLTLTVRATGTGAMVFAGVGLALVHGQVGLTNLEIEVIWDDPLVLELACEPLEELLIDYSDGVPEIAVEFAEPIQ